MKIHVLTIPASEAEKGLVGPHLVKMLVHHFPEAAVTLSEICGDSQSILGAFEQQSGSDFIITTGGCGLPPDEIVPEVTKSYCTRIVPGIAEILRFEASKLSPYAALTRGTAGIKDKTVIINIPGSLKAALLCIRFLIPLLSQSKKLLNGEVSQNTAFSSVDKPLSN
jgi:molybdenum cofactor synthesis domain-containing protein